MTSRVNPDRLRPGAAWKQLSEYSIKGGRRRNRSSRWFSGFPVWVCTHDGFLDFYKAQIKDSLLQLDFDILKPSSILTVNPGWGGLSELLVCRSDRTLTPTASRKQINIYVMCFFFMFMLLFWMK